MANLSIRELTKPGREYRAQVIIRKIQSGEPFELDNGTKVKLVNMPSVIQTLSGNLSNVKAINFMSEDGRIIPLTKLKKNKDFGGKGEGSGTIKEDRELASLNKQLSDIKMQLGRSLVPIRVKNTTYLVDMAVSTPGTPKSDFHLIDADGKEVVWISHKDGRGPKDFQQWGGISQSKEPSIFNHIETQTFIRDLKAMYPNGLPPATSLFRKIKDNRLKMLSVYGNKFGGTLGQQNVSILLQGPVQLVKRGSGYELTANHVHFNADSVDDDGFEPVFMAIYKGDRSDAGVKGTRIVIMPIAGRKASPF